MNCLHQYILTMIFIFGSQAFSESSYSSFSKKAMDFAVEAKNQGWFQNPTKEERAELLEFDHGIGSYDWTSNGRTFDANLGQNIGSVSSNGWNSSGGGGGIACFATQNEADTAVDKWGRVKREQIPQIKRLVVFDYFDAKYLQNIDWRPSDLPKGNESSGDFLNRTLFSGLESVAPLLLENLLILHEIIPYKNWVKKSDGLARFNDTGFSTKELNQVVKSQGPCIYVQLASRYVKSDEKKISKIEIHYDEGLLKRMSELVEPQEYQLQVAILTLHEIVYTMAREVENDHSANVRALVSTLLSPKLKTWVQNPQAKEELYIFLAEFTFDNLSEIFSSFYTGDSGSLQRPPKSLMLREWNSYKAKTNELSQSFPQRYFEKTGRTGTEADIQEIIYLVQNEWIPQFIAENEQTIGEAFFSLAGPLTYQGIIPNPEVFLAHSIDHSSYFDGACTQLKLMRGMSLGDEQEQLTSLKAKLTQLEKSLAFCKKWGH